MFVIRRRRCRLKTGLNDKALNRIIQLQGKTTAKIAEFTKGTKPFAQKPLPMDEVIWALRNTSEQDRMTLIQEFGADAVNKLLYKAIMTENRRKQDG